MKVWVIMCNDDPEVVCDTEAAADAWCAIEKKRWPNRYFRSYAFTVKTALHVQQGLL